jgi:hypothetical protein
MADQRIEARSPFRRVDGRYGETVRGVRGKPIDRFSGHADEAAGEQSSSRLADLVIADVRVRVR